MYYTGIDPLTGKDVYCPTDYREKQLQRALLQYYKRENAPLVREALKKCGREDLIGYSAECLVRPERAENKGAKENGSQTKSRKTGGNKAAPKSAKRPKGWAVPKKTSSGKGKAKGIPEHRIIKESDLKRPHKPSRNKNKNK